ncbi:MULTISPECIES: PspA/IM30 family protein [Curtobacterium]|uniref:PspA/IM30 family protein n=1 Tax=Curtobacterium TaxID=2034 RepID=UPI000DA7C605|nr:MULTISPECIES: PspA/IM30 family protein [Curtobacterium]MBY0176846.1 PspA/IM30 family protein [Curtobacterium herbarum]MCP1502216.1 phage shock protein A [Curtobacterium herbarum]MDN3480143.1 PspA/IM30 family protein [Curtobacterium sp. APC 4022]MDN4647176.1 PspA/IM30 family protein [Curtobacterium sp. PsM8]MDY1004155.1 PspA/IM30 family protein [Curtobacterium sp. CFBP9011]
MAKQSIFGRISTLVRANINQLIDNAEDPQLMLDQLVRDYSNNIADAKSAIAQTIGNLRLLEQDNDEDVRAAQEWGQKAANASTAADRYRAEGKAADADKFDNLAKIAIGKQIAAEQEVKDNAAPLATQNEQVEKLKQGLAGMEQKLEELRSKRNTLVARAKTAEAQSKVNDALGNIDITDPTSDLARFEEKVRREEAKVIGQQELQASSLDAQFESLEDVGRDAEVEARLAALKSGGPTV